ncbi:hypothetical protein JXL21_04515 [Candidatus Bathyarchaeota archaeon]|nr:hypothetical protein [Candidatus Bathyarchaeota archaeon]
MPSPVYLKCSNPGCGKQNPVYGDIVPGKEYTCIFCGCVFKAPEKTNVETVDKIKRSRGKKPRRKESRPENRNLRKPMV